MNANFSVILLLFIMFILYQCTFPWQVHQVNQNEDSLAQVKKLDSIEQSYQIAITGKNIWVRSEPSTGEVVMKLNDGDTCRLLEKGKREIVKGIEDNWYKIKFHDKAGWVFGSQTSFRDKTTSIRIGNDLFSSTISQKELIEKVTNALKKQIETELFEQQGLALTNYSCSRGFADDSIIILNISTEICDATCFCDNFILPVNIENGKFLEYSEYLSKGISNSNLIISGNVRSFIKKISENEYLFLIENVLNAKTSFSKQITVYPLIFNIKNGSFNKLSLQAATEIPVNYQFSNRASGEKVYKQEEIVMKNNENELVAELSIFVETYFFNDEKSSIKLTSRILKSKTLFVFNSTSKTFEQK